MYNINKKKMENNFNLKKFLVENKLTTNSRIAEEEQEDGLLRLIQDYVNNDYTIDQGYGDAINKAENEQIQIANKIIRKKGEKYLDKVKEIANLLTIDSEYSEEESPKLELIAAELGFTVDQIRGI